MYTIKEETFEGPLDLLLSLIEKEQLDICQISLSKVTSSYLEAISSMGYEADEMAEFLIIAAKLLYIKSRQLIPNLENNEEETEIQDLEERLREYQKYKLAAKHLENILSEGSRSYRRKAKNESHVTFTPPNSLDSKLLFAIFQETLSKAKNDKPETVTIRQEPKVTMEEKRDHLIKILKKQGKTSFRKILLGAKTKIEIIVTFLVVLEMIKQKEIKVTQNNNFADFEIISL